MSAVHRLSRSDVLAATNSKLAPFFRDSDDVAVAELPAINLLEPRRFDVAIKVAYAKDYLRGGRSRFAEELYVEHVRAFNGFVEMDNRRKTGHAAFLSSFNRLIDSISREGLRRDTLFPVSRDGVLLDGAHRLAVCIALGLTIRVVQSEMTVGPRYDARFFELRGLGTDLLDAGLLAYVGLVGSARLALVWPAASGRDAELTSRIERQAKIVARKDLYLQGNSAFHLVKGAYQDEPWLGSDADSFAGTSLKASRCFRNTGPLRVLLVESSGDLSACKSDVRELFNVGKHSIHITDTHEETQRMARVIFNANSLHAACFAPVVPFKWFDRMLTYYKRWLTDLSLSFDAEAFSIDGSAILAVYGAREVRDLDYIYAGVNGAQCPVREISLHHGVARYYPSPLNEIVSDPRLHFYFNDVKFVSLSTLCQMKARRGEPKDMDDLSLVARACSGASLGTPLGIRIRQYLRPTAIKARLKMSLLRANFLFAAWLQRRKHTSQHMNK